MTPRTGWTARSPSTTQDVAVNMWRTRRARSLAVMDASRACAVSGGFYPKMAVRAA